MDHVVVGIDPTDAGARALRWALREAVAAGARVTAVRSWTVPDLPVYVRATSGLPDLGAQARATAQETADEQLAQAVADVPGVEQIEAKAVAVMGRPAHVLVDAAKDADLVVVGPRGAGVLSRAVLGSVSSAVLHHATCPVAVVPASGDVAWADGRVLVGVDHSPESLGALRYAVDLARRHGTPLVPVFVEDAHNPRGGPHEASDADLDKQRTALQEAAAAAGADDLQVEPEVVTGSAAQALRGLADPHDVLVLGSRGRGGFTGLLLGSTSTQSAQHAHCPVVVVRGR